VRAANELGAFLLEEIERGVRTSRATVVVLSSAFLADGWALFGQQLAAHATVTASSRGTLIPLLLEDCQQSLHLQSLVKLDFRDRASDLWRAEIDKLRGFLGCSAAPEPDLPCPYPGMRPFFESDAERFFGRDVELSRIIRRMGRGEREIYIIGASGSGKSSLVAAGLLPRLGRGIAGLPRFCVRMLRPGERPVDRLGDALAGDPASPGAALDGLLAGHPSETSLLLVIDQLEEVFAISVDKQRRDFFVALRTLRADRRCALVFTLRADFYGAFMNSPLWTDRDGTISRIDLGPLRRDGLRQVIEQPARSLDVYLQPELLSRLLDHADGEPGALPLLQETLCQLWGRRRQRLLAFADYHAMGDGSRTGLAFAVKEHADDVLGALSGARAMIALRILLRLVSFGEGRADTRRQRGGGRGAVEMAGCSMQPSWRAPSRGGRRRGVSSAIASTSERCSTQVAQHKLVPCGSASSARGSGLAEPWCSRQSHRFWRCSRFDKVVARTPRPVMRGSQSCAPCCAPSN